MAIVKFNGLVVASVKKINGLVVASIKKRNGLDRPSAITYATLDPSNKAASITLSNGNLTTTDGSDGRSGVRATLNKTSGKWYWEGKVLNDSATPNNCVFGLCNSSYEFGYPVDVNCWGYHGSGALYHNASQIGGAISTFTTNDVIGFAWDVDNGTLSVYKNNTLQTSSFTGLGTGLYPHTGSYFTNSSVVMNFGASTMDYSPPSGYNAGFYS